MDPKKQHEGKVPLDLARVRALVEPIAVAHGVRLLDVEWTTGPPGRILRLTLDRAADDGSDADRQGVTLDDCVRVSRDASTALDVEDLIGHAYNLEVSSPGLTRPLRSAGELSRLVGHGAKVKLSRPAADGQRLLHGQVVEVGPETLRMVADGNEHEVPLADVVQATRVLDFGAEPKANRNRRGKRSRRGQPASGQGARANGAKDGTARTTRRASRKGSSTN